MAAASNIIISTNLVAEYAVPNLTEEAAAQASEVLEENHEKNDIIFTDFGLHSKFVCPKQVHPWFEKWYLDQSCPLLASQAVALSVN